MKNDEKSFFWYCGGRKQFNGYLYSLLVSLAAWHMDAGFEAYAMYLGLALLGTSAIVATEDMRR